MTSAVRRHFGKSSMAMLAGACMALFGAVAAADSPAQLKIGLLMDLSRGSPEVHEGRKRGFDLAISHVNDAGGVFGRPVATVVGDTRADPVTAVAEARRLVEEEGVHVIVGPSTSASALSVAAQVTGPAGVPTVSNSATSPRLSRADDGDFLFRTTYSDIRQGPVLARVARERGFDNVGLLYRDDAWGQGLAGAFAAAWEGELVSVATGGGQTDFMADLRASASRGAQALVVVTFETEAELIVRQALAGGLYDRFVFGDAAKRLSLVRAIGGDRLGGMHGTGPAALGNTASGAAWGGGICRRVRRVADGDLREGGLRRHGGPGARGTSCRQRRRRRDPRRSSRDRRPSGRLSHRRGQRHCRGAAGSPPGRRHRLRGGGVGHGLGRERATFTAAVSASGASPRTGESRKWRPSSTTADASGAAATTQIVWLVAGAAPAKSTDCAARFTTPSCLRSWCGARRRERRGIRSIVKNEPEGLLTASPCTIHGMQRLFAGPKISPHFATHRASQ